MSPVSGKSSKAISVPGKNSPHPLSLCFIRPETVIYASPAPGKNSKATSVPGKNSKATVVPGKNSNPISPPSS